MPKFSITKGLIVGAVLMAVLAAMGMFKAHIERLQQAAIVSAVDAATQKLRAEITEASQDTLRKSEAQMADKLEGHAKRLAAVTIQQNQLLSQVNGISDAVAAPVPVAPQPAQRPKPQHRAAHHPQRDSVNRAHRDADRMLERASGAAAAGGGAELAPAAPAAAEADRAGAGGLFGLWK